MCLSVNHVGEDQYIDNEPGASQEPARRLAERRI
jgi:hypothetical protein